MSQTSKSENCKALGADGRMERADLLWAWCWGAVRWEDETLTQLSPVEGQSMPGIRKGLQGEDISAKTHGPAGATVESGDSTPGRDMGVGNPQCSAAKSGRPESGEGHVEWRGILPTP